MYSEAPAKATDVTSCSASCLITPGYESYTVLPPSTWFFQSRTNLETITAFLGLRPKLPSLYRYTSKPCPPLFSQLSSLVYRKQTFIDADICVVEAKFEDGHLNVGNVYGLYTV